MKHVSKEFVRLEKTRIKADVTNSIECGGIYGICRIDLEGQPTYLKVLIQ